MLRLLSIFFLFFLGFTQRPSTELHGKVLNAETGLPVSGAYLYTLEGEEEALTGKNGEFRFKTWKIFPIVLTVQHKDYQQQEFQFSAAPKQLHIKLKRKIE